MKIPNKFKIIGFDWVVKNNKDVIAEGGVFGSTHTYTQTIFLDPETTQQKKEQTFLHECMHAIWWQTGLGKRYDKDKAIIEEEIVSALSSGLYQVLKENNLLK